MTTHATPIAININIQQASSAILLSIKDEAFHFCMNEDNEAIGEDAQWGLPGPFSNHDHVTFLRFS